MAERDTEGRKEEMAQGIIYEAEWEIGVTHQGKLITIITPETNYHHHHYHRR